MNRACPAIIGILALAAMAMPAHADVCRVSVEANDLMQFNQKKLEIGSGCSDVELTLHHVGKQPAQVMGHNWVLVRNADVAAVAIAGQNAGRSHNYQPQGDKRIIAATALVGGGETTTVMFSTASLRAGNTYTFFCSTPGHRSVMHGVLVFGDSSTREVAVRESSESPARGNTASPPTPIVAAEHT